jgi:VIT1/CCC1 family predicted Fe2+/Mn2+ transporter
MDGSVSTLAPIFAVFFATHTPFMAFLIGMAAAVGGGISMAFAEALSDDGKLSGRGSPLHRGAIIGCATLAGGIFHAVPFLIPQYHAALIAALVVVGCELVIIAFLRHRYFGASWSRSILQVFGAGVLVALAGYLLGSA